METNRNSPLVYYDEERYEELLQATHSQLLLDPHSPDLHACMFFYRALHNEWEGAWHDQEYRGSRRFLRSILPGDHEWAGEEIHGKTLLIVGENGIGDTLMFSRWLEQAHKRSRAEKIIFAVRPELQNWEFGPADWLLTCQADPNNIPLFDYWIGLQSLPLVTRSYAPFPTGQSHVPKIVSKVGICWRGNPRTPADSRRSTPLKHWRPLLQFPGIAFRSLQYGEDPLEGIEPLGNVRDIADTALKIRSLNLVITVDTSIAHLAAIVNVPVWMLLYRPPEWRWGLTGESSIWYRCMRIFRQEKRGEWEPVFKEVQTELQKIADTSPAAVSHQV